MSDDPVTVLGGVGGAISCLEDLDVLATRLDLARERLAEADRAAYHAYNSVNWTTLYRAAPYHVCDPIETTALRMTRQTGDAYRGEAGIVELVRQLQELAERVRLAQAKYQEAEQNAQAEFSQLGGTSMALGGWWLGPFGLSAQLFLLVMRVGLDAGGHLLLNGAPPTWADLLRRHHAELRAVAGTLSVPPRGPRSLFGPPDTNQAARGVTALATLLVGPGLDMEIERLSTERDSPPSGIESLIWRIRAVRDSDPNKDDSQIGVSKVTAKDGSVSWLVTIPGTQALAVGWGSNAAENGTNVRAVSGDTNAIGLATTAAMIDAGVRPGEPVVLAGHSQGGIVGAALAADPEFTSQFAVAAVLTAGSPVSQLKPANSAQWLSLEHHQDPVPTLDGANNARSRNHTTVVRDLTTASHPYARQGATDAGKAHDGATYATTARLLDRGDDPSIAAWREAAAPVLDHEAQVETTIYKVKRTDGPTHGGIAGKY
ncbi:MAG: hypothetical protein LBK95_09135 [Bifidobacteriaceae bacterium]|jgi:hypothetical protein|nr:hypothetical protein [Bifidobacteriaceae bacterium]